LLIDITSASLIITVLVGGTGTGKTHLAIAVSPEVAFDLAVPADCVAMHHWRRDLAVGIASSTIAPDE
jgi:DNA replication protein DnaC